MLPFRVDFVGGIPAYRQILHAVRKGVLTGGMRPGDPFPSAPILTKELRVHPNTANWVITQLREDRVIEERPDGMLIIAHNGFQLREARLAILETEMARFVREVRPLSLDIGEVEAALRKQWVEEKGRPA